MSRSSAITMSLYIGPVIPIPAPRIAIEALSGATVSVGGPGGDGFELTFALAHNSGALQTLFLLTGPVGGAIPPMIRVVIATTIGGVTDVLIDGVVTQTTIAPGSAAGSAQLTVKGRDLTAVMDSKDLSGLFPYPAMPVEARVALILAKYAMFGVMPLIVPTPTVDINNPISKVEQHWGTDLQYLRKMASWCGYTFHIEPGPAVGTSIAYWGPTLRVGPVQKALNVDMDMETNVESVNCSFDHDTATLPVIEIENPVTRLPPIPIPIGLFNPLDPPLGLIPALPNKIEFDTRSAGSSFPRALMRGWAKQAASARSVTATGTLDALRYGRPLKARQLVGLRGVGLPFNGLYYVQKVESTLKRGEFKQQFTLVRNGLISTVERIPA